MHEQQKRTLYLRDSKGTWQNDSGQEVCASVEGAKAADEAGATLCGFC